MREAVLGEDWRLTYWDPGAKKIHLQYEKDCSFKAVLPVIKFIILQLLFLKNWKPTYHLLQPQQPPLRSQQTPELEIRSAERIRIPGSKSILHPSKGIPNLFCGTGVCRVQCLTNWNTANLMFAKLPCIKSPAMPREHNHRVPLAPRDIVMIGRSNSVFLWSICLPFIAVVYDSNVESDNPRLYLSPDGYWMWSWSLKVESCIFLYLQSRLGFT